MSKLNEIERREYKKLKNEFKNMFPRACNKQWNYFDNVTELYWQPFPDSTVLTTRTICSVNDEYNKKRGKLECLRKVWQGIWLPEMN